MCPKGSVNHPSTLRQEVLPIWPQNVLLHHHSMLGQASPMEAISVRNQSDSLNEIIRTLQGQEWIEAKWADLV